MTKKILNTVISDNDSANLADIRKTADKVIFEPSSSQQKAKARFWTKFQPGPMSSPDTVTLAQALELTGMTSLRKWWSQPGFRDYFVNREEEREKIKYLFNKSLDTLERILDNPDANANAKANIIKMLAEMNGYLGKKPVEKFADDNINKMSQAQLEAYLESKGVKFIKGETVVDVRPEAEENVSLSDSEAETPGTGK